MVKLYKSAAVVALLVVSSAASAATSITLTSAGLYAPGLITITPAAGTTAPAAGNYYASVLKFAAVSGGAAIDLLGFCIDLFHPISAGIDSQSSFSLTYASLPLTNDQNSTTLSGSQVQQMMGLASLGFTIAASDAPDRASRLAAIQQAIWTIEYPTLGFAAAGGYATQQGLCQHLCGARADADGYCDGDLSQRWRDAGLSDLGRPRAADVDAARCRLRLRGRRLAPPHRSDTGRRLRFRRGVARAMRATPRSCPRARDRRIRRRPRASRRRRRRG